MVQQTGLQSWCYNSARKNMAREICYEETLLHCTTSKSGHDLYNEKQNDAESVFCRLPPVGVTGNMQECNTVV